MKFPLCGHQKTHKQGKTSNVVNDIILLNAYKLSPILLTLSTIVEQFNLNKRPWFWRLKLRAVV